jgi:hypothetical protein
MWPGNRGELGAGGVSLGVPSLELADLRRGNHNPSFKYKANGNNPIDGPPTISGLTYAS